jgi:hypothetical protein
MKMEWKRQINPFYLIVTLLAIFLIKQAYSLYTNMPVE